MSATSPEIAVTGCAWNIRSGGVEGYDPECMTPEREEKILEILNSIKISGDSPTILSILDAFNWDTIYGDNEGIANHLGFTSAFFQKVNDERLNRDNGRYIGNVFATNEKVHEVAELDLGDRCGIRAILDIGKDGLQVGTIYLDDLSEAKRIEQIKWMLKGLEPDIPTILQGDFNIVRPSYKGASIPTKAGNLVFRALSLIPSKHPYATTMKEMAIREAYQHIVNSGFTDADSIQKRPTARDDLPIFGVDYVFHSNNVEIEQFETTRSHGASDHRPISYRAKILR